MSTRIARGASELLVVYYLNPLTVKPNLEPKPRLNLNKPRIHVEHVIERLRNCQILYLINSNFRPLCDKVVQVCAAIIKLQSPITRGIFDT